MTTVVSSTISSTGVAKSKKLKSLVVTDFTELQGEFLHNARDARSQIGFSANKNTALSIPDDANGVAVTAYTSEFDPLNRFNVTTGTWTCPVTGIWLIEGHIFIAATAATVVGLRLTGTAVAANSPNGSFFETRVGGTAATSSITGVTWSGSMFCTEGQTLLMTAIQTNGGGAINLTHARLAGTYMFRST